MDSETMEHRDAGEGLKTVEFYKLEYLLIKHLLILPLQKILRKALCNELLQEPHHRSIVSAVLKQGFEDIRSVFG